MDDTYDVHVEYDDSPHETALRMVMRGWRSALLESLRVGVAQHAASDDFVESGGAGLMGHVMELIAHNDDPTTEVSDAARDLWVRMIVGMANAGSMLAAAEVACARTAIRRKVGSDG